MKLLCRIISIRKHKNIFFCDVLSNIKEIRQICFEKKENDSINITTGEIIIVFGEMGLNRKKEQLFFCERIKKASIPLKSIPMKSYIANRAIDSSHSKKSLYNSLSRGYNQNIWLFRMQYIDLMNQYLQSQGFIITRTKHLMNCRGTYNANPFTTINRSDKKTQYLRITMELELKKTVMVTLQAVAEIGTVYRNMGKNTVHATEFHVLELIKPLEDIRYIVELMKGICKQAISIARSCNITYDPIFENLNEKSIYQLIEEKNMRYSSNEELYELYISEIRPGIDNLIVTDIPSKDPFVRRVGEWGSEVEWVIHGKRIAHGFEDEIDSELILQRFIAQVKEVCINDKNAEVDYEFIDMLRYGYPPSVSLGMGVDRFISYLLQLDHIQVAINPLGI